MVRILKSERAQTLPLMALLLTALIGMLGLAVDAGRVYIARAEMSRALDAAALAGVLELPDLAAAEARAAEYMTYNQPATNVTFPTQVSNQFRVQGNRNVNFLFIRVLGVTNMTVKANATAGFGTVPSDTVVLVDATGSMGSSPCNSTDNNPGCPIFEAKNAATDFAGLFLGSGSAVTKVGYTPFRGCHNPPRTFSGCVTNSQRVDLTTSLTAVENAIAATTALGGTGTNVCLALYKAQEMFNGPNAQTASNVVKSLVLLSDGDNTYNASSYSSTQNAPPANCRPTTSPSTSDVFTGTGCSASGGGSASSSNPGSNSETRERQLDTATNTLANTLKAANVEIYVIAFGVCGTINSTVKSSTYCSGIGNTSPDTTADQRVLKCIASSTAGTNDHFFSAPTAADLPDVFEDVAHAIAFRLIE